MRLGRSRFTKCGRGGAVPSAAGGFRRTILTASSTPQGMLPDRNRGVTPPSAAALHAGQISEGFLTHPRSSRSCTRLYRRVVRTPVLLSARGRGPGRPRRGFLPAPPTCPALYRSFLVHDGVMAALACWGAASFAPGVTSLRLFATARATAPVLVRNCWPWPWRRQTAGWGAGRPRAVFLDEIGRRGGEGRRPRRRGSATTKPQSRCTCRAGFRAGGAVRICIVGTESLLMLWFAAFRSGIIRLGPVNRETLPSHCRLSVVVTAVAVPVCMMGARLHRFGHRRPPRGPQDPRRRPVPYLGGVAVFAGWSSVPPPDAPSTLIPLAAALGSSGRR